LNEFSETGVALSQRTDLKIGHYTTGDDTAGDAGGI
jgi:hypothetical protein